jgi:hypothetical protein
MHRFWNRYIGPIVELVRPGRVLEVGAEFGWNTRHILAYCRTAGAKTDIVDPAPGPELRDTLAQYSDREYRHHALKGVDVIPRIEPPDIALIDGDPNWHTVYTELTLLFGRAAECNVPAPIVFLHGSAWPYARRDMYYVPESIDPEHRHPYAYEGIIPGRFELTEEGLNGHFANALHEGGPQNGVLTAIEDFVKSSSSKVFFYQLPFFNGLAILVPKARQSAKLRELIDGFFTADALMEALKVLENYSMMVRVDLAQIQIQLTRRTDALSRARRIMAEQGEEIARLRAQLATARETTA